MPIIRASRFLLRIAISIALLLAILWAAAALWIDGPEPRVIAGTLAGGALLAAGIAAVLVAGRRCRPSVVRDRAPLVADARTE